MGTLTLDGYKVAYEEQGHGETVVLVHGSNGDARTWTATRDALAADFRVVTYARRYHWPNAPIGDGVSYAMAEHVADLGRVVDTVTPEAPHLVGHSYGALLCLLLALERPAGVRSLTLIEPPALRLVVDIPPRPAQLLSLLLRRPRTAVAVVRLAAFGLRPAAKAVARGDTEEAVRHVGEAVLGPDAYAQLTPERLEQARANLVPAEILAPDFAPLPVDTLQVLAVPTLVVTGERSPALFRHLADQLVAVLPQAERMTIPGASHLVHEDAPEAVHTALGPFLARHRAAA